MVLHWSSFDCCLYLVINHVYLIADKSSRNPVYVSLKISFLKREGQIKLRLLCEQDYVIVNQWRRHLRHHYKFAWFSFQHTWSIYTPLGNWHWNFFVREFAYPDHGSPSLIEWTELTIFQNSCERISLSNILWLSIIANSHYGSDCRG
jgi:hypothetical protein